uniref:Uncharacterized protein n=1 Tax=Marseillevirus LCMAC102 TaxID=2506603 RepID=A0A481YUT8_9VIRU|nr:MAG: hypothetical protein LCMAC102_04470 [Marseillevirus LCMAC102]
MASYGKRLHNEMILLEEQCDRYISYEKYYVINIEIIQGDISSEEIQKWSKTFLTSNRNRPIAVYIYQLTISLIFSCLEENESHYLQGSHQNIISDYTSIVTNMIQTESNVKCNIVEFDTQTQIFTYFLWKVYCNSRNCINKISPNNIKLTYIKSLTLSELINMLKDLGIDYSNLPSMERYGIFFKLKRKKNKIVVVSLSEEFDARDTRKYTNFIFG